MRLQACTWWQISLLQPGLHMHMLGLSEQTSNFALPPVLHAGAGRRRPAHARPQVRLLRNPSLPADLLEGRPAS